MRPGLREACFAPVESEQHACCEVDDSEPSNWSNPSSMLAAKWMSAGLRKACFAPRESEPLASGDVDDSEPTARSNHSGKQAAT
jgi:hypothetical protein